MAAVGSTTAQNTASTATVDPYAEQNKAIKQQNAQNQQAWQGQQPMMEGNQQANFVPLNKSAYNVQNQTMNTAQGNDAVLGKLQQTVLGQQPSQVMPLLQQKTASYLQDPNLGYNPAANKQMQLEQYDREASKAMEAARQQLGDTSQSGELKNEFLKNVLTNTQNRGDLSRKIDTEAATQNQTNLLNALAQGRAQVGTENETNTANINDLVAARGAAEGERSQDSANAQQMAVLDKTFGQDMAKMLAQNDWQGAQNDLNRQFELTKQSNDINAQSAIIEKQIALDKWKQENGQQFTAEQNAINNALQLTLKDKDAALQTSLMELKGKIDKDQLVTAQDFEAVQNDLDRKQKDYFAKGEWQNALDVIQQKGEIDAQAQKAQQNFEATQTKAAQAWQTSERLGEEDFAKASQVYDYQMKIAMQSNDAQLQKDLKDQQAKIDLKMKTQDLSDDQAKMYLQAQLDEAKANKDVGRQQQILSFQTANDFAKMEKQNGYDVALKNLDAQIQSAASKQDFQQTEILQKEKLAQESLENAKDRVLQQAEIDLKAKGVDMEAMEQKRDWIQGEIDAKRADPSTMTTFVQGVLDKAGVKITQPDPDAERKAAEKQYNDMLYQYRITHPETYGKTWNVNGEYMTLEEYKDSVHGSNFSEADMDTVFGPSKTQMSTVGQKAFNEFFNNATYGELTAEQKKEKANAGYLGEKDLPAAAEGDSFNFDNTVSYNGLQIPAGKYHVEVVKNDSGSKFFGTKTTQSDKYLVSDENGGTIKLGSSKSGTQGNIVSSLWADS